MKARKCQQTVRLRRHTGTVRDVASLWPLLDALARLDDLAYKRTMQRERTRGDTVQRKMLLYDVSEGDQGTCTVGSAM